MRTKVLKTNLLLVVLSVIFLSSCSSLDSRYQFVKCFDSDSSWVRLESNNNNTYYKWSDKNLDIFIEVFTTGKMLTIGSPYLPIIPVSNILSFMTNRKVRVTIWSESDFSFESEGKLIKLNNLYGKYRQRYNNHMENDFSYSFYFNCDLDYIYQMELIFDEFEVNNKKIKIPNLLLDKVNYIGYREFFAS